MSRLWVPPQVDQRLVDGTRDYNTHVLSMLHMEGGILDEWNKELVRMDPHLRLAQASPQAETPLAAGFYHLVRLNPGAPITVQPITGPSGEFVEPGSQLLDRLREMDLQNVAARVDRLKRERYEEHMQARERERDDERRRAEVEERWAAATRAQVSMNRDTPWHQNAAGRRGRKAA